MKKETKPFSLDYAEAKRKVVNAVNEATQVHGVPFYLLEDVLENILCQVKQCAENERRNAQVSYEKQIAESKKEEG